MIDKSVCITFQCSLRTYNEMRNASHKAENTTTTILAETESQMGGGEFYRLCVDI